MTTANVKHLLRVGSEAHYVDAQLYDKTYARRTKDKDFYCEEIRKTSRRAGAPRVLEVGAGSGRISVPLVRQGAEVTATDPMESMLLALRERAAAKLDPAERERLHVFRVGATRLTAALRSEQGSFDYVILPFNVLMHCYTTDDLQRWLTQFHAMLKPSGKLIFDVLMPDIRAFVRDPQRAYRAPDVIHPVTKERFGYEEYFAYDAATQVQTVTIVLTSRADGRKFIQPLTHRQFFPQELGAALVHAGFSVESCFGDFDRSAPELDCESQIFICKPQRLS